MAILRKQKITVSVYAVLPFPASIRGTSSTYNRRTHFTPIWYPDGSYTVNTWVIDCWTPAGMLSVNLTDSLNIRGNLWDDWHIAPLDL